MAVLRQNVHRRSRRLLTRGQSPRQPVASVAVTSTGTTNATLTYNTPIIANGNLSNTITGLTLVSQVQTSPTVVTQTWSGNVTAKAYVVPSNDPAVSTYQGGGAAGAAGTFS